MSDADTSPHCHDCFKRLTVEERIYYVSRCERCERKAHEYRQAWRLGEIHDPELDAFYSSPTRGAGSGKG